MRSRTQHEGHRPPPDVNDCSAWPVDRECVDGPRRVRRLGLVLFSALLALAATNCQHDAGVVGVCVYETTLRTSPDTLVVISRRPEC